MSQVVETVESWPDVAVKIGLGTPTRRGFVALMFAAGILYTGGLPRGAFDEEGGIKQFTLGEPGDFHARGKHFLVIPLGIAVAAATLI